MEITTHINNDLCCLLAQVARFKACEIKVPMVIAFADARGEMVHFQRMDKALPASSDIAVNKAFTAAALAMPTHKAGPLTRPGQPLCGLELTNNGRIIVFGGGFPLALKGCIVGAIGVSGGSVDEDMAVARAAVNAFDQMAEMAAALAPLIPGRLKEMAVKDPGALVQKAGTVALAKGVSPAILEGAFYLISTQ